MKFDGMNFTRAPNVVILPMQDENGNKPAYLPPGSGAYVGFGRVTKLGAKKAGAIKTSRHWTGGPQDGEPVYATLVDGSGYSLTNMMYGKDGNVYLAYNGECYICRR